MCLIAVAYKAHAEFPLIVAANRDEFLDRPASPMHFWPDAMHILAGRDLRGGGTWMGITRSGHFAAITNHRDLRRPSRTGPSRGLLVRMMLDHHGLPSDTSQYDGFNLLFGHWQDLHYHNNIDGSLEALQPGVHGLSNAFLDTPWPKVARAMQAMEGIVADQTPRVNDLFELLADEQRAEIHALPDTGVGEEMELILSPVRIQTEGYATRCSTVVMVDVNGAVYAQERTFQGRSIEKVEYELQIRPSSI